jgi:maltose alpha-D-glucosyltransferase/alpha-amylase
MLKRKRECIGLVTRLTRRRLRASKTRIHGDYHLGQVLLAKDDWIIVDFEGEPAKPIRQRRAKYSPLRDVAGMLRSIDYALAMALTRLPQAASPPSEGVLQFGRMWRDTAVDAFLSGYHEIVTGATDPSTRRRWLDLFMLEKACYEIVYEVNNRPDWLPIPLRGVAAILDGARNRG